MGFKCVRKVEQEGTSTVRAADDRAKTSSSSAWYSFLCPAAAMKTTCDMYTVIGVAIIIDWLRC